MAGAEAVVAKLDRKKLARFGGHVDLQNIESGRFYIEWVLLSEKEQKPLKHYPVILRA